jgi:hypothetical protein
LFVGRAAFVLLYCFRRKRITLIRIAGARCRFAVIRTRNSRFLLRPHVVFGSYYVPYFIAVVVFTEKRKNNSFGVATERIT